MENTTKNSEEFCKFDIEGVDPIESYTRKVPFGCGNMYVDINVIKMRPVRVFIRIGKCGACQRALLEAVGRLVTIMLEQGDPLERIVHTLIGIRCTEASVGSARTDHSGKRQVVLSCMDALAKELKDFCVPEEIHGDIPM